MLPSAVRGQVFALSVLMVAGCSSVLGYDELSFGEPLASGGEAGAAGNEGEAGAAGQSQAGHGGANNAGHGGAAGSAGTGGQGAAGSPGVCGVCEPYGQCDATTLVCECNPGFVAGAAGCEPVVAGDPATHTEQQVCEQWAQGHVLRDASPWSGDAGQCDAGTLSRGGINDTLARLNMFRWLVGLGPVTDDAQLNAADMACAVLSSFNPPADGYNPHAPDPARQCYSAEGALAAASSNIAWGPGHPAHAIDQYVADQGNETTYGHRRWILSGPLGPVGVGYYAGGGTYGNAQCLGVFGTSNQSYPDWVAMPPPGFSPVGLTRWGWTFHHKLSVDNATMTVTRASDGTAMPMTKTALPAGYGAYATVAFQPDGWVPEAGQTYQVSVAGVTAAPITYEVKPVNCP